MLKAAFKPSIVKIKVWSPNLKKPSIELTPLRYLNYILNNINSKLLYILRLYKVYALRLLYLPIPLLRIILLLAPHF